MLKDSIPKLSHIMPQEYFSCECLRCKLAYVIIAAKSSSCAFKIGRYLEQASKADN